jgi:hypothetical protein
LNESFEPDLDILKMKSKQESSKDLLDFECVFLIGFNENTCTDTDASDNKFY